MGGRAKPRVKKTKSKKNKPKITQNTQFSDSIILDEKLKMLDKK